MQLQLHQLIDLVVTFVVFPGCIGIGIHRWRRGYRLHYLIPDWIVLAYVLLTAASFAAQAATGESLSGWDLVISALIAVILIGMVLDRTTAERSALYFWIRGVPWPEALVIGRKIRAEVDAAMAARRMRD